MTVSKINILVMLQIIFLEITTDIITNDERFMVVDKNECALGTAQCSAGNSICTNTDGSYTCTCLPGYTLESDGHTCIGMCIQLLVTCMLYY